MHHTLSFIFRIVYAAVFCVALLFHTVDIINYIPQLLGGLLILESVSQMFELAVLKFRTTVTLGYFVTPALVLLFGLYLTFLCDMPDIKFFMPGLQDMSDLFRFRIELKIAGCCFLAILIEEAVISFAFFKPLFRPEKFAEEKREAEKAAKALAEAEAKRQSELQEASRKLREMEQQASVGTDGRSSRNEGPAGFSGPRSDF